MRGMVVTWALWQRELSKKVRAPTLGVSAGLEDGNIRFCVKFLYYNRRETWAQSVNADSTHSGVILWNVG